MDTPLSNLLLPIFTERDYDYLNWHDNQVHAMAFNPESFHFLFDIDYIFNWKDVKNVANYLVGPSTLIFDNVHNVTIAINSFDAGFLIDEISREALKFREPTDFLWTLKLDKGQITFVAKGFTQFNRKHPSITTSKNLSLMQRGGISFHTKFV